MNEQLEKLLEETRAMNRDMRELNKLLGELTQELDKIL